MEAHPGHKARLFRIFKGDIEILHSDFFCGGGHGQHSLDRAQAAVEGELPQEGGPGRNQAGDFPGLHQHGQSHGQVEVGAPLFHFGGHEGNDELAGGIAVARAVDGGPDAFAGLPDADIGHAYDLNPVLPLEEDGFDVHGIGIESSEGK